MHWDLKNNIFYVIKYNDEKPIKLQQYEYTSKNGI